MNFCLMKKLNGMDSGSTSPLGAVLPTEEAGAWGAGHSPAVCVCTQGRLLRGSGLSVSRFPASAVDTQGRGLCRGLSCAPACSLESLVPGRCHCGNHTFLNGPGDVGRSHTRCCCIFSEHRRHLSPHPLCVDSWVLE